MQLQGSDVLEWNQALETGWGLLKENKNPKLGLLILCGVNFGLRISDLLPITWEQLRKDDFIVVEKKTKKKRKIVVNPIVRSAVDNLAQIVGDHHTGPVFISQKGTIYSQQHVNRMLKRVFGKGVSSHGLRKTFGRRLYEASDKNIALVQMQLNHSSPVDTLRYIGITQQKLDHCYSLLV